MKNICMVSQSAYPQDPRVRREAEALEQKGYHVDIICLRLEGQSKIQKFGNITSYRILKREKKERVRDYIILSIEFFFKSIFASFQLLKKRKYELAQAHNMPDYIVFALILFKLKKIPVVLDVHDLTYELFESKWPNKPKLLFSIVKFIEKISYNFADHLITVTKGCEKIVRSKIIAGKEVSVILNTANQSIFKFDAQREFSSVKYGLKIIYHGSVAERFGLHTIIDSLKIIKDKIPGVQLYIYGKYDESYLYYLKKKTKEYDLESNIFFNDQIAQEQIYQKIKLCDLAIVPYVANEYMNLAFSTKTFEYAASGIPIIATDLQSLREIFSDKAILYYSNEDYLDLSHKIVQLCNEPEKRESMVKASLDAIEHISGSIMAEKYCNIIEGLIHVGEKQSVLVEV